MVIPTGHNYMMQSVVLIVTELIKHCQSEIFFPEHHCSLEPCVRSNRIRCNGTLHKERHTWCVPNVHNMQNCQIQHNLKAMNKLYHFLSLPSVNIESISVVQWPIVQIREFSISLGVFSKNLVKFSLERPTGNPGSASVFINVKQIVPILNDLYLQ